MKGILYRPIEQKDYAVIGEIINEAFGLYRYVPHPKLLENVKQQYVYSCLSEATYTCVAEQNGEVVGVIMGNAKFDYKFFRHLSAICGTAWYSLKLMLFGWKSQASIKDYKNLHKVYNTFSQKHKGEFDGILTLFAVRESCRGFGVGKKLLNGLLEYLRNQGTHRIYLYTDDACNTGFYEHQGFERLEEQPLDMIRDGKTFELNVFLYGYSLDA